MAKQSCSGYVLQLLAFYGGRILYSLCVFRIFPFPFQRKLADVVLHSTVFIWTKRTKPFFTGIFRSFPRYMPPATVRRIDSLGFSGGKSCHVE